MRISAGLAEIGFANPLNNRIASEKFFVWPLYNAGKVEDIHGVTRRTESNIAYSKPTPEDHDRLLAMMKDNPQKEYSPAGTLRAAACGIQPGSFFDAIA
ncbi:MAG TPA: hypothetical protein PLM53_10655 [Spirochaetota bacterium]|nr:hypothetical protein [Spirochaetota bacterium]HPC39312.1 hypothetical protein [Spirochaetota bacterium]HPL15119.1 hypothetical protein [Spirochaetota bacterium]HQF08750.1 hypothetical protein [Spirochaetota bacterium]HQH97549.1 hypothetical protein [Spirochaetota bacterium]